MDVRTSIIFCDSIQNNIVNGKLSPAISRPLSSIIPYAIPGNYSFSLYFQLIQVIHLKLRLLHLMEILFFKQVI